MFEVKPFAPGKAIVYRGGPRNVYELARPQSRMLTFAPGRSGTSLFSARAMLPISFYRVNLTGGSGKGPGNGPTRLFELKEEADSLFGDIRERLSSWINNYGNDVADLVAEDKDLLEMKLELLDVELESAMETSDISYARNVVDAIKILFNRVIRLERTLFDIAAERTSFFKVSLYDEERPVKRLTAEKDELARKGGREYIITRIVGGVIEHAGEIVDSLVSRSRGDFISSLRPGQWDLLRPVQADWGMHERLLRMSSAHPRWHEGVVVAPTGSGKTHVMAASIELGMKEGWLDFSNGAKVVIETHLKEISRQNIDKMHDLLDAVFKKYLGRGVKVTSVGEGLWDLSGDIIIVSVPTVGKKDNAGKLKAQLMGAGHILLVQDEYHHAMSAESWITATEAVKSASANGGYVLGFTATLPMEKRSGVNIVAEQLPSAMMKNRAIPEVDIIQVSTGTDLQTIPTRYGNFYGHDLSNTVRNLGRYEHMMRALEAEGEKNGRGGLAPTLIFGVDIAHVEDLAKYYQLYFARKVRPNDVLGERRVAVIDDRMRLPEVRYVISEYRSKRSAHFARYEYGRKETTLDRETARKTGVDRPLIANAGEYVETKIDGIVAVITGDTPTDVRKEILSAAKKGDIECIVSAKVFAEGADAWWAQNLVGAKPSLSFVQKTQEFGRLLRYGPDEIDNSTGTIVKTKRRVAIDLVDFRSGLVGYFDAIGMSDSPLRYNMGLRINGATQEVKKEGYKGQTTAYDKANDRAVAVKVRTIDPKMLTTIKGEREHFLLPEASAGEFAKKLRNVLKREYRGDLKEMAFDLAIPEETLVGYLNGGLPSDPRMAKRMGILLYQGRGSLLEGYSSAAYNWKPLAEISEAMRPIVGLMRKKLVELFDGELPYRPFRTKDGFESANGLNSHPMLDVLKAGVVEYSNGKPAHELWMDVRNVLLYLERDNDGSFRRVAPDAETEKMILAAISEIEGWLPLDGIDEALREIVELARKKEVLLFGGRLPSSGFMIEGEGRTGVLAKKPLNGFIIDGDERKIIYSNDMGRLWDDLKGLLLYLEPTPDGKYVRTARDMKFEKMIEKAVERLNGWLPIEEVPEDVRELVRIGRLRSIELFGGRKPKSIETEEGWISGSYASVADFLRAGEVVYSGNNTPDRFWTLLRNGLFYLQRSNKDRKYTVREPDAVIEGLIEKARARIKGWFPRRTRITRLNWLPMDKVPAETFELLKLAREKAEYLFDGDPPFEGVVSTTTGWESGIIDGTSPLRKFLATGVINFSKRTPPKKFWNDLLNILFRLKMTEGGQFESVDLAGNVKRVVFDTISFMEGWEPLEKVPEHVRPLLKLAREKAAFLFGGRIPFSGFETADGFKSQRFFSNPLNMFLKDGTVGIHKNNPAKKFWGDLKATLLGVDFNKERRYVRVAITGEADTALKRAIEKVEGWLPLEMIPEKLRQLVELVREKNIGLYGGRPPSPVRTIDGWEKNLDQSPLKRFSRDGVIKIHSGYSKETFKKDLTMIFLGVEETEDGRYRHVDVSKEVHELLEAAF